MQPATQLIDTARSGPQPACPPVLATPHRQPCPFCRGQGRLPVRDLSPCPPCAGSGELHLAPGHAEMSSEGSASVSP